MNIKFISSAGYQLWASEGVIVRYIYRGTCPPNMTSHEYGDILIRPTPSDLTPIMEASTTEDLRPRIDVEDELRPRIDVS